MGKAMSFVAHRAAAAGTGAAGAALACTSMDFSARAESMNSVSARSSWAFSDLEFKDTTSQLFRLVFGFGDDDRVDPGYRLETSGWDRVVDSRDKVGRGQVFMSAVDLSHVLKREPQNHSSCGKKVVTVAALVTVEDAEVRSMMRFFSDTEHRPSWDKKVVSIEHIDSVPSTQTHCNLTTSRYLPKVLSDRDYCISTRSEYYVGQQNGCEQRSAEMGGRRGSAGVIYMRTAEHEDAPPRKGIVRVGMYEQAFLFAQRGTDVDVALVFEHENVIKMPRWVERWALSYGVPAYIQTAIAAYQQYRFKNKDLDTHTLAAAKTSGDSRSQFSEVVPAVC